MASRRRYDDVLSLTASVLFGSAIPSFNKLAAGLISEGVGAGVAYSGVVVFLAVYFRNLHGWVSFDNWMESHHYTPPWEQTNARVALEFLFAVGAIMVLPYSFLSYVSAEPAAVRFSSSFWFTMWLLAPLTVYIPWNLYWFRKLQGKDGSHDLELRRFVVDWIWQDGIVVAFTLGGYAVCSYLQWAWSIDVATRVFVLAGFFALAWDYATHLQYYFAVPD